MILKPTYDTEEVLLIDDDMRYYRNAFYLLRDKVEELLRKMEYARTDEEIADVYIEYEESLKFLISEHP